MDNSEKNKQFEKTGRIGYRPYWVLNLSIGIRAIHQLGAAIFLASYLLEDIAQVPPLYLWLAMSSGIALTFTEWMRHRQLFRELSGVGLLVKLALLGAAYHGFILPVAGVVTAFLVASITSHAPKYFRHRLIF